MAARLSSNDMATILVSVYPMAGPINSTKGIARDLRGRGHRVHYIGRADCAPLLKGESFFPVFIDSAPAGLDTREGEKTILGKWWHRRKVAGRTKELIRRIQNSNYDGFDEAVEVLRPDLMLILCTSHSGALWSLLAHKFRIPSVYLNDSLISPKNSVLPPVMAETAHSMPMPNGVSVSKAWKILALKVHVRRLISRILFGLDVESLIRQLAKTVTYPASDLVRYEGYLLCPKLPEIILLPKVFDFPHETMPGRFYSSPSVDLLRSEIEFDWSQLHADLPVIYCSLGTVDCAKAKRYQRFFLSVVEGFAAFSDRYQLVIVTRGKLRLQDVPCLPPNVLIVDEAPQLAMLSRSVAMIGHGGGNSTRECMTLGVPMLLYPIQFDEFGFASRVEYHGLGLRGEFQTVNPDEVKEKLTRLLTSARFRIEANRMKEEVSRCAAKCSAASLIERFLRPEPARFTT
jgi:zeaxanthin glucosyltransferase